MGTVRFSRSTRAALAAIVTALAGSAAAAQGTKASGGDVATFTQKHLVNHLIVGDSIEMEMAQLAATRTQNAAVKDFANQLVTDQTARLAQLNKLAANGDIGREANPSDTTGAHLAGQLASLKSMAQDSGFDLAFTQDQIELHQTAIDGLKALRPAATSADVRNDIDATLPVLEKHLAAAQQLAVQLSKADSSSQKPDMSAAKPAVAKPPVAKPPV
jgi:putative membrane protein